MEKSNFFSYAGFHFQLCSLELRELFAHIFESPEFANTVRTHLIHVQEFVPLYTCNRFDMCFFGKVTKEEIVELFWAFALHGLQNKFSHISMCHVKLKEHVFNSLRFA